MEAITWFIAGAIAAAAGVALGVTVGPWASWAASIAFGAVVVAGSRRISAYSGAALVAGVTGAQIAGDVTLAVAMVIASMALMLGLTLGYIAAWLSSLRAIARRLGHVEGHVELAPAPNEGSPAPRNSASAGARPLRPSHHHAHTERLASSRVDRLVRLAADDSDAFRAALSELSTLQRHQVRQALPGRRGATQQGQ